MSVAFKYSHVTMSFTYNYCHLHNLLQQTAITVLIRSKMWIVSGLFRDQDTKETLANVVHRLLKPGQVYKVGRGKEHLLSFAAKYASSEHFSIRVGEHTRIQAADPSYTPPLTLIAQPQGPSVKPNGPPKTFAVYLTKKSELGKLITEGGEFELSDGDEIRINKPDGVAINIHWKPVVLHNASNATESQRIYSSYNAALASMGVKTHRSPSVLQTHTILPEITEFSTPVVQSLVHGLQLINLRWISYVVGAGDSGREEGEKFWSSAELDFNVSWPNEDDFRPEIKIDQNEKVWDGWRNSLAKIRPNELDRERMFGGLSFYVLIAKSDQKSTSLISEMTEMLGATCCIQNVDRINHEDIASFRITLEKAKQDADDRYAKYLRDNLKSLPEESKGSGLVLVHWSDGSVSLRRTESDPKWTNLEETAAELGLVWLNQIDIFRAILEANVKPLFEFGRTDEQPSRQSLPSQVGDSMESSDSLSYAKKPKSGDSRDDRRRAHTPAEDAESLSCAAVPSTFGNTRKPLVRRRPVNRAPLDDLVASLLDDDAPLSIPPPITDVTTTKSSVEPGLPIKRSVLDAKRGESSLTSKRLVRRERSRRIPNEDFDYVDDPSIVIEESLKAREVYDRIRESAMNLDVPMLTNDDEDDDEEDFIEESRKKLRLKREQEHGRKEQQHRHQENRANEEDREETESMDIEKRDPRPLSESRSDPEGLLSLSARGSEPSSLSRKPSGLEMPPPSTIPKRSNDEDDDAISNKKRPAEEEPEFLTAPSKRRKGTEVDPLDEEFNKLKLAKQNLGDGGKIVEEDKTIAGDKVDGFAMVCVVKPLLRKDPRVERSETDYGTVPNFKKFKKQHVVRSAPIKFVGSHISSIRGPKIKESQSSIRIPGISQNPAQSSASISNTAQSLSAPRPSQRKRLLRANSNSDDEGNGAEDRPNLPKRSKTGKKIVGQKSIVLSSDDDELQIVEEEAEGKGNLGRSQTGRGNPGNRTTASRATSRVPTGGGSGISNGTGLGGNRKKLILVDSDSEEEVGGFKGFGGGGSMRRK